VEVKVQQRRPDGGSIPPIARINFFLFLLCLAQKAEQFFCRGKSWQKILMLAPVHKSVNFSTVYLANG
jgi:hypothetical protein